MRLYREFTSQEELDREYNPAAAVSDANAIIEAWQVASARAREAPGARLRVAYGPTRAEHAHVFPAGDSAPVHLFIHGGYWRRFSADDFALLGPMLNAAGFTAVIVNYALCPVVTIDEIVRQVRAAIVWAFRQISEFGGDPEALTISGHSAGGHLTAMALATDWQGDYALPLDIIKAALPISGLFDLAPFPYTYLQPALQLGWGQVRRNSPSFLEPHVACPVTVAVGGAESAEFRRQSRAYVEHLVCSGRPARYLEIEDRNHFNVLDGFAPEGPLMRALHELCRGTPIKDEGKG